MSLYEAAPGCVPREAFAGQYKVQVSLSALAWAAWNVSILPGPKLAGSQPATIRGKNGPPGSYPGPYPIPTFLEIRVPLIH